MHMYMYIGYVYLMGCRGVDLYKLRCVPKLILFPLSPVPQESEIAWSSPSDEVQRLTQNNAILIILAITTEDEGVYSCQVDGLGTYSAVLTVHGNGIISDCEEVHVRTSSPPPA